MALGTAQKHQGYQYLREDSQETDKNPWEVN